MESSSLQNPHDESHITDASFLSSRLLHACSSAIWVLLIGMVSQSSSGESETVIEARTRSLIFRKEL
jgi:hypothetical protein